MEYRFLRSPRSPCGTCSTQWDRIPHIFLTLHTVCVHGYGRSVFPQALMMAHPARVTRDTATYRPYQKAHGKAGGKLRPKSLKVLSKEHLDRTIQSGQHSPVRNMKNTVLLVCGLAHLNPQSILCMSVHSFCEPCANRLCPRFWWGGVAGECAHETRL